MDKLAVLLAALLGISAAACRTPRIQPLESGTMEAAHFASLQDGSTTREDILLWLGDPSGIFEEGRILTYVLRIDEDDELHVLTRRMGSAEQIRWRPGLYSLVLVFGPSNVLERHSVVVGE